jgi:NYN domain-containing protein
MLFVDGENFTIRAQEVAQRADLKLDLPKYHERDVFVWVPAWGPLVQFYAGHIYLPIQTTGIRAYYYTSVVGDDDRVTNVRESLRALQFDPRVFKRESGSRRSKGVDITLTKDMLSHAFPGNFDAALLVAGDGDYVPLVEEVKRLGKRVYILFFGGEKSGLNRELRLAADGFFDISEPFVEQWRKALR